MNSDIFVARQPIFDAAHQVMGYELLFRSGPENYFKPTDSDVASSMTIDRATMSIGLEEITQGHLAFLNLSRRVLLAEFYTLLPTKRTVLELLETVAPDRDVIDACYRLKAYGYRLALDDYTGDPALAPLLPIADIVKIDLQHPAAEQALKAVAPYRDRGVSLVAERVETIEMQRAAVENGYDLFQGYFFCRPEMLQAKDVSPSKLNILRFLAEVCSDDASFERLEDIFKQEVSLSTRLLRYLNSAGFGWNHEINSLGHALRLVGLRQLRKWGAMMGVMTLSTDRPRELATTALSRARFSEHIGQSMGHAGHELELFLTGLLSLMDAMVGKPLREVLSSMAISEPVRVALLEGGTPLSDVLGLVTAYERGDWSTVQGYVGQNNLEPRKVQEAYTGSLKWAHEAMTY